MDNIRQVLDRIRQHHAVEHATIHILSQRLPDRPLAGHSDSHGIRVLGPVPTTSVQAAVEEALRRLPHEPELAVHPLCGTNLVVGGTMAGLLSLFVLVGLENERRPWRLLQALPRLITAATAAFALARFAGPYVQRHWTTMVPAGDLVIDSVRPQQVGNYTLHRVKFRARSAGTQGL